MSSNLIRAYAAMQAGAALQPYQFDAGELQPRLAVFGLSCGRGP